MLFRKPRTFVIDLDTLADARIARFIELGFLSGRLILPEPEAAGADDHRARRAQETIERLRRVAGITVKLDPALVDRDRLIAAVKRHKATLITSSPDLKAVCTESPAVTFSDIYNLFKPSYLPGTTLRVRIVKKGKEKDEGIGHLEGGVKVVVENAATAVGSDLEVVILGTLDTDVGQVVFAKPRFTEVH
ncbi:MAG: hypothetical protein ABIK37_01255 [candidate division WOR-3 bacterium]